MIKLGLKVKDKVTGFEGVAVARIEYLNGCVQYGVKPKVGKDGKIADIEYIDENQLKIISGGIVIKKKDTGGIMHDAPKKLNY